MYVCMSVCMYVCVCVSTVKKKLCTGEMGCGRGDDF